MDMERQWRSIAARQHQLITRAQLADVGLTRAKIRSRVHGGVLVRVHRDVFRLAGVRPTWRQRNLAAVLASGPNSVVSHEAGARLWGFDGGWSRAQPTISVLRPAAGASALARIHQTSRLPECDRSSSDGIAVTTPARTLIDLAAVAERRALEAALDAALRDGVVREPFLRWRILEVAGRGVAGSTMLAEILGPDRLGRDQVDSWLEARALELFDRHGLPAPECQRRVRPDDGRVLRIDFSFLGGAILVEVNGHATHSTRRQRQRDHERANRLGLAGIVVLQFTFEDVAERPAHVAAMVRAAVETIGFHPACGPNGDVMTTSTAGSTGTGLRDRRGPRADR
jgi:hypothetical protein